MRSYINKLKNKISAKSSNPSNPPPVLPREESPALSREEKVFYSLNKQGRGLEIGASHAPLAPKSKYKNAQVLDHASAADLKEKYKNDATVRTENIEEVDYVWSGEPYHELIGETHCFDWIIGSHLVEHVPDLVAFLQNCEKILKPDGLLSLAIPDKRYCFDYFRSLSNTSDVLDAFLTQRIKPTPGRVFECCSNITKRGTQTSWGQAPSADEFYSLCTRDEAVKAFESAKSGVYMDTHCWTFIPPSFALILSDLQFLGLLNLSIVAEFETEGNEFFVTLGKADAPVTRQKDRIEMLKEIHQCEKAVYQA